MIIFDLTPFLPKRRKKAPVSQKKFHHRIIFLQHCFRWAFFFLCARILQLSFITNTSPQNHLPKSSPLPPPILDANNNLLATNIPTFSLYINAQNLQDPEYTKYVIKKLFPEINHKNIAEKITQNHSFIWVKRHLTPKQKEEVLHHGLVGAFFHEDFKRIYPMQSLTAHIIGLRDIDNKGLYGLERHIDDMPPQSDSIVTTIDIRIQSIVHRTLTKGLQKFKAKSAGAILMNIETGAIISLCALPDFDPNDPSSIQGNVLFNSILQGSYELGSIMKIFTFAQGIEENLIDMEETLNTNRTLSICGFTVQDHHPKPYNQTVTESFINSSNIGCIEVFKRFGHEKQMDFWKKTELFEPLSIEVKEVIQPTEPLKTSFTKGLTASYGYGISLPPIRFILSASSLITGKQVTPFILQSSQVAPRQSSTSQHTASLLRKLLFTNACKGTSKKSQVFPYLVGGKTGSSQKTNYTSGYSQNAHNAFFIAFFPMNQPKFALFIFLEEPQGTADTFFFATSGWTAAPLAQKIIKHAGPILNVTSIHKKNLYNYRQQLSLPLPQRL